ncbi:MAG: hypothetical protein MUF15_15920, partial [Acidobacteria bacterium]|nr:hypothetical protein [Acidobacteriota bacterium]
MRECAMGKSPNTQNSPPGLLLFRGFYSSSFIIHHSSFIIHHSSFIIHHSSFIIHHSSFII